LLADVPTAKAHSARKCIGTRRAGPDQCLPLLSNFSGDVLFGDAFRANAWFGHRNQDYLGPRQHPFRLQVTELVTELESLHIKVGNTVSNSQGAPERGR